MSPLVQTYACSPAGASSSKARAASSMARASSSMALKGSENSGPFFIFENVAGLRERPV